VKQGLERYPRVDWPEPERRESTGNGRRAPTAVKQVEMGRLGSAARIRSSDTSMAAVDASATESLRSKHPTGHPDPFGPSLGPQSGAIPSEDDILAALKSFKPKAEHRVDTIEHRGNLLWRIQTLRLSSGANADQMNEHYEAFTSLVSGAASAGAPLADWDKVRAVPFIARRRSRVRSPSVSSHAVDRTIMEKPCLSLQVPRRHSAYEAATRCVDQRDLSRFIPAVSIIHIVQAENR